MERLFPGYGHELEAAGAISLHMPTDALILTPAGWLDRRATGWPLLSASQPLYEWAVRRRLRELPGVTILDRHDVTALLTSRDGQQVVGTTLRPLGDPADDPAGAHHQLAANLVVDAGGRGSRTPAWLSEAGYDPPAKTQVDPNVGYAARIYRIPDGFSADWQVVMLASQPPSMPRTGYLFPIEDGQWMVGLMGAAGQHPPTDEDGFAAFTRSLRHPAIATALAAAEPVTPIRGYRGTANRLWHYERCAAGRSGSSSSGTRSARSTRSTARASAPLPSPPRPWTPAWGRHHPGSGHRGHLHACSPTRCRCSPHGSWLPRPAPGPTATARHHDPGAAGWLAPVTEDAITVTGVRSPYLHAGSADAPEAVVFVR